jgi:hypothetical protein
MVVRHDEAENVAESFPVVPNLLPRLEERPIAGLPADEPLAGPDLGDRAGRRPEFSEYPETMYLIS